MACEMESRLSPLNGRCPVSISYKHDAERPNVSAVIELLALHLLGGHIRDRSRNHAGLGRYPEAGELGQTKVEDLDDPAFRDEEVGRLDVAMHDSRVVRFAETAGGLGHDIEGFLQLDGPLIDPMRERLALVVGHHEIELPVGRLVDFVNGADVDVVERRRRPGFVQKALLGDLVPRRVGGEDLDGDLALETRISGPVNDSHPTAADAREDFVWTQLGPGSHAHARAEL